MKSITVNTKIVDRSSSEFLDLGDVDLDIELKDEGQEIALEWVLELLFKDLGVQLYMTRENAEKLALRSFTNNKHEEDQSNTNS
jgi:hypothetical protein